MQNIIFETIYVMFWQDWELSTTLLNLKKYEIDLMKLIFSDDTKLLKNTWLKRQAPFYIKGKTIQQLEIIQEKNMMQSWVWWWILYTTPNHNEVPFHASQNGCDPKVYKQGEKTAFWMGENNSKWSNWQTTNLKNRQATPTAQFQKNKWPSQKMGQRTK